jgi:hypothetical protein
VISDRKREKEKGKRKKKKEKKEEGRRKKEKLHSYRTPNPEPRTPVQAMLRSGGAPASSLPTSSLAGMLLA